MSTASHSIHGAAPSATAQRLRARRCIVRIDTEDAVLVGTIYIPDNRRRVSDVLADERSFLNLTDVSVNGSDQIEPFIALNKNFIRTLRVVHEAGPRPVASALKRA